ncbi:MAG: hypothetical protein HQ526_05635, partial [Actinobacteria bacterium]|nr:hypothetical protein [Actinomycetota bacterium]
MTIATATHLEQGSAPFAAHSPSVRGDVVRDRSADVALFGEDIWPLAAIGRTTGAINHTLDFTRFPNGPWRETAKHIAYQFINEPTPDSLFCQEGSGWARWPSQGTIRGHVDVLRCIVEQIEALPKSATITGPSRLSGTHLNKLRRVIDARTDLTPEKKNRQKSLLVRLPHHSAGLPMELQWPAPLWDDGAKRGWSTPVPRGNNKTRTVDDDVMAMLLQWALTMVAAAEEIFAGYTERQRLDRRAATAGPNSQEAARILAGYIERGEPVPGSRSRGVQGRGGGVAVNFLAGTYGIKPDSFDRLIRDMDFEVSTEPDATSFPVPITATIQGRPWIDCIGYYEYEATGAGGPELLGYLQTACLIVISYLTGMRDREA